MASYYGQAPVAFNHFLSDIQKANKASLAANKGRFGITVLPRGPFFERDPEKTFDQNVEEMMAALAREGEAELKTLLQRGEPTRQALSFSRRGSASGSLRVSTFVHGRVAGTVPWHRWAAVSPYDESNSAGDAIAVYAAAAGIQQRTHAFSTVASRLRKSRAAQVAELTRGIE